jgi:hypothetical protein
MMICLINAMMAFVLCLSGLQQELYKLSSSKFSSARHQICRFDALGAFTSIIRLVQSSNHAPLRSARAAIRAQRSISAQTRRSMSSQGETHLSQSQRIVWGVSLSGFLTVGWSWSGIDLPEQLQSVGVSVTSAEPAAVAY